MTTNGQELLNAVALDCAAKAAKTPPAALTRAEASGNPRRPLKHHVCSKA